ncbi:MAG: hypothetical protein MR899_03835, partial [Clostridium sp.]|nr:hypothetical protein [Clostridium sp.]
PSVLEHTLTIVCFCGIILAQELVLLSMIVGAIQLYHRRTFSCSLFVTHVLYLNITERKRGENLKHKKAAYGHFPYAYGLWMLHFLSFGMYAVQKKCSHARKDTAARSAKGLLSVSVNRTASVA